MSEEKEFWWIYSEHKDECRHAEWAGLRIAVFLMVQSFDGPVQFFSIFGEVGERIGIRIWDDVSKREGWRKVEQIKVPVI
jgi:hypothetical protein